MSLWLASRIVWAARKAAQAGAAQCDPVVWMDELPRQHRLMRVVIDQDRPSVERSEAVPREGRWGVPLMILADGMGIEPEVGLEASLALSVVLDGMDAWLVWHLDVSQARAFDARGVATVPGHSLRARELRWLGHQVRGLASHLDPVRAGGSAGDLFGAAWTAWNRVSRWRPALDDDADGAADTLPGLLHDAALVAGRAGALVAGHAPAVSEWRSSAAAVFLGSAAQAMLAARLLAALGVSRPDTARARHEVAVGPVAASLERQWAVANNRSLAMVPLLPVPSMHRQALKQALGVLCPAPRVRRVASARRGRGISNAHVAYSAA